MSYGLRSSPRTSRKGRSRRRRSRATARGRSGRPAPVRRCFPYDRESRYPVARRQWGHVRRRSRAMTQVEPNVESAVAEEKPILPQTPGAPHPVDNFGKWMVLLAAFLGWMFDGLEMGIFPLVSRPALESLLKDSVPASELGAAIKSWHG